MLSMLEGRSKTRLFVGVSDWKEFFPSKKNHCYSMERDRFQGCKHSEQREQTVIKPSRDRRPQRNGTAITKANVPKFQN